MQKPLHNVTIIARQFFVCFTVIKDEILCKLVFKIKISVLSKTVYFKKLKFSLISYLSPLLSVLQTAVRETAVRVHCGNKNKMADKWK